MKGYCHHVSCYVLTVAAYVATAAAALVASALLFIDAQRKPSQAVIAGKEFSGDSVALLEIYRQKYLNFRHFDTLRWGVHTVVITAAGLVVTFAARAEELGRQKETTLLVFLFGAFAILCWWLLYRLAYNHMKNSFVLEKIASQIGDPTIPEVPRPWRALLPSAAFAFMAFVGAIGWVAILITLFRILAALRS